MRLAPSPIPSPLSTEPPETPPQLWTREVHLRTSILLLAILTVGATLRFALLGQHSLWSDEAFVAWAIRFGWKDIFSVLAAADSHPPLYYVLIKAWAGLAGTGEAALRAPSAVLSTLSVLLTYLLMLRVAPEPASLLSALLVAVSPFDIMAGQEARMYPLLSALAVGSTLALVMSVERESALRWAAYVLLATLMVYTHYLGALVLLAHGAWVVGFARRSFVRWAASMAVAAILYAPWGFAVAIRVADVAHIERSAGGIVPYLAPDDLLALFAFGGSLFGTATYFGAGRGSAPEHIFLLLPFLVILWRGAAALSASPRSLGLIVLPPLVTLGIAAPIALAKPILWPRAFSFLAPFYAMVLAQGIVDVAQIVGRQRARLPAAALLLAGLLAPSIPVLHRYYFDPGSRPYQWRAAAAAVTREARTGDYFLFVGRAAGDSFTYYFRQPYPSRTLVLRRDPRPTFTPATARQLASEYQRVWVILSTPYGPTHPIVQRQVLAALASAFRVAREGAFNRTWVYLLVPRDPRTR